MTPRLSHFDAVTRVAPIFGGSLAAMAFEALVRCPIANGRGREAELVRSARRFTTARHQETA